VILDAGNDAECLGQLVDMARELYRTTLVQRVAGHLGSREAALRWLRSLPQANDDGDELYQYVRCDVPQRTRLFPPDPNCFERTFAALVLLEALDPTTARMVLTIERPARHTGIVEPRGGRWVALDLFPRRRRNDSAQTGRDVLKGIHDYVGKPLLSFFLGADTGGKVADTVGAFEDQITGAPPKSAAPKAPPSRRTVSPPPTAIVTRAVNAMNKGGNGNGQEEAKVGRVGAVDDAPGGYPARSAPEEEAPERGFFGWWR
jgi:hypothetical protein